MAELDGQLTLAGWNALEAKVANVGNTKLVWGTYTGGGWWGEQNPTTLTFDGAPLWLHVSTLTGTNVALDMFRGQSSAVPASGCSVNVTWTDNGVSWWYNGDPTHQLSLSTKTYYYIALIGV